MAEPSLQLGNGNWAGKSDNLLAYHKANNNFYADELTFARASSGTRVNSNGLIETAEIIGSEQVTNGDFVTDLSGWNIAGNDATHTVTWTSTGARFQSDTTSPVLEFKQLSLLTSGTQYVLTCNVAYTGAGRLRVNVGTNLTAFTEGANTRYFTASSSTMSFLRESANLDATIDNVSVKEVITLNIPRVDYLNNSNGSLLLEPQRTNTVIYSEDYSQYLGGGVTLTTGQLAPDGTYNATKLSGTIGSSSIYKNSESSTTASRSIYARTVSGTGTARLCSYFNNTNNLFTLTEQWQRFELTNSSATGGTNFYAADFRGSQTLSEFIIWGAQSEEGSYSTSYIPTSGTTVTRLADTSATTGLSDVIGQTEGVLFVDFEIKTTGQDMVVMNTYNTSTPANGMYFYLTSSNVMQAYVDNSGTQVTISTGVLSQGTYKAALAYKANDCVFYLNGSLVGTDVSNTIPTCDALRLENYAVSGATYQEKTEINQAQLYKTALTNAELATLTTI